MLKNVSSVGAGWVFTDKLVDMKNSHLSTPETRSYTNSNGVKGTETVIARNNFWEVVQRGPDRELVMREKDNSGKAVKPSDALNDLFNNKSSYQFDCATPMHVLNLKATLDTIGADDFNSHAGRMELSSWYDQHDSSNFDGGFNSNVRTANAGEVTVNGKKNIAGETALFDPSKGDKLVAGGAYYFDKPGDVTSAEQGWNAIYLGQTQNGQHRFWTSSQGEVAVNFANNSWMPTRGFSSYYLGAVVSGTDTSRLQNWDTNSSV
jgi:hypothetical protein